MTAARGTRSSRKRVSQEPGGAGGRGVIATHSSGRQGRPSCTQEVETAKRGGGCRRVSTSSIALLGRRDIVPGSLVLLGGEAGDWQVHTASCRLPRHFAKRPWGPVLYAFPAEGIRASESRAAAIRLGVGRRTRCNLLSGRPASNGILEEMARLKPAARHHRLGGRPSSPMKFQFGRPASIGQVREAATQFSLCRQGAEHPDHPRRGT